MKRIQLELKLHILDILQTFSDIRTRRNAEKLIQAIIEGKTTKLKTIAKDNKEYENFHNLLNGELKNVLDAEKINKAMGTSAVNTQEGKYCVYVIHDESDIRKPESQVLENLGAVRDLKGNWITGYSSYNIILVEPKSNKVHLYSCVPYSNSDPNFVSKSELALFTKGELSDEDRKKEIECILNAKNNYNSKSICLEQIQRVHKQLKSANPDIVIVHILDRGFDDKEIFELLDSQGDKFVVRGKGNRNANEKHLDEKGNEVYLKLTNKRLANQSIRFFQKIQFKKKVYADVKCIYQWDTTIIGKSLWNVLRIEFYDRKGARIFKDSMLLLTNYDISNSEIAIHVNRIYLQRPKIESVFKFLKENLGWEEFRIHDYESIKNIIALTFFIGGYFYEIEDEIADNKYACWLAELGGGKGKITRHFFMKGLSIMLQAIKLKRYMEVNEISQQEMEEAIQMFSTA